MDLERINSIYDELSKYEISLASDPASMGPKYLTDVISVCRNYINNVSRIMLEVHREKHNIETQLNSLRTLFSVESNELLSSDASVMHLPSIDDRKAKVSVILSDRVNSIGAVEAELQNLEYVEKAIKHRHRELKDTMSEIRLQRSLIRDELDTKAYYGDERTTADAGADKHASSVDIEAIEAVLAKEFQNCEEETQ